MKTKLYILFAILSSALLLQAQPQPAHYAEIDGKSDEALLAALKTVASKGYHTVSYKALETTCYPYTDVRDGNKVWDMYSDCSFVYSNKSHNGNSSECAGWNKEHSIPQSCWGGGESNEGCDVFHVVPTDCYVNNRRGSDPYGEVSSAKYTSHNGSKSGTSKISGYSGNVFEPIDEYKGDLARGVLGAMVKWQKNWTKGQGNITFNNNFTKSGNFGLTQYGVNVLIKWCRQDPVSQKELDRNNAIEKTQGNRNPFIDYPDLIEYLWGDKKGQKVSLATLQLAYSGEEPQPGLFAPTATTEIEFTPIKVNQTTKTTVYVKSLLLTQDINIVFGGTDAAYFSVEPAEITASAANQGTNIVITYAPKTAGSHSATLILVSSEIGEVTVPFSAYAAREDEQPPVAPEGDYEKVSTALTDWTGVYLIVNESNSVILNGAQQSDKELIQVNINDNKIAASEEIDNAAFTIEKIDASKGTYSITSKSGYSYGLAEGKNALSISNQTVYANLLDIASGDAIITCATITERTLRYNSNNKMFRFYTTGQQPVQLYRKAKTVTTLVDQTLPYDIVLNNNQLTIRSSKPVSVNIYNRVGQLVAQQTVSDEYQFTLTQGFYLLQIDGHAQKIIIP